MASSASDGRHAAVASATDGEVASAQAFASLRFGEAPRVGLLGDPGCGKTEAGRRLVNAYLRSCPGVVLVCDDKPEQQYAGPVRRSVEDLRARPTAPADGRVIVFKPDPFSRAENDPESIADLQWKKGKDSFIAWALGKGRSAGAATLWGTQLTEKVPAEAFDCSSAVLAFRMVGNPVRLLKQRGYCEGGADKIIPRLPGDELPPQQRGYFVLLLRGRPWDGRVYRYSAPK
jgi:hypothetical protein